MSGTIRGAIKKSSYPSDSCFWNKEEFVIGTPAWSGRSNTAGGSPAKEGHECQEAQKVYRQ